MLTSQCCCLGSFAYKVTFIKKNNVRAKGKIYEIFVYLEDSVAVPLAIDFLGAQFVNKSKK